MYGKQDGCKIAYINVYQSTSRWNDLDPYVIGHFVTAYINGKIPTFICNIDV